MKKTTLLSLATAAAVITTSVGTFAAFDKTSANNTGNGAALTFKNPITVELNVDAATVSERSLNEAPSVTTTATVEVANEDNLAKSIALSFDLGGDDGSTLKAGTDYTLNVAANSAYSDGSSTISSSENNINFTDSNATTGTKTYDVTVTLTDDGADAIAKKGAAANVTLEMTATLN
nr:hypothetical protein [uncultured Gemmiger sp.]